MDMQRKTSDFSNHLSIFEQGIANTLIFTPMRKNVKAKIDEKFSIGVIVDSPLQEQIADNALACEGGEKDEPLGVIVGAVKFLHDLDAVHRRDGLLRSLKQADAMKLDKLRNGRNFPDFEVRFFSLRAF